VEADQSQARTSVIGTRTRQSHPADRESLGEEQPAAV